MKIRKIVPAVLAAIMLTACGGGGKFALNKDIKFSTDNLDGTIKISDIAFSPKSMPAFSKEKAETTGVYVLRASIKPSRAESGSGLWDVALLLKMTDQNDNLCEYWDYGVGLNFDLGSDPLNVGEGNDVLIPFVVRNDAVTVFLQMYDKEKGEYSDKIKLDISKNHTITEEESDQSTK